jgi:UDP-GlcNAc:undecaprenyl-phosphate GlcNAc-1-phosphate transferase
LISDVFAVFWIVYMMNMLNMGAKGVDGQLPGVVVIAAITIAALSLSYSADITQWPVIIFASITAGAYFGFLPWNFYPQKIMPGYGGGRVGAF